MTSQEIGQKVKTKYPQYAQMSDEAVGNLTLKKYPQYGSSDTATSKVAQKPQESVVGKAADVIGGVGDALLGAERKIPGAGLAQDVGTGTAQLVGKLFGKSGKDTAQQYKGFLPDETVQQMGDHPVSRIAKDIAGVGSWIAPASGLGVAGLAASGGLSETSREQATPGSVVLSSILAPILGKATEGIAGKVASSLGRGIFGEAGSKLPQIIEETGGAPITGSGKEVQQNVMDRTIKPFSDAAKKALGSIPVTKEAFDKMIEEKFPSEIISNLPGKEAHPMAQERQLLENLAEQMFGNPLAGAEKTASVSAADIYDKYVEYNSHLKNSDAMKALGGFLHGVAENPEEYAKYQDLKRAAGNIASSAYDKGKSFVGDKSNKLSPWLMAHLATGLPASIAGLIGGGPAGGVLAPAALFGAEALAKTPSIGLPLANLLTPGAQMIPGVENSVFQQALSRLGASGISNLIFPKGQEQASP